MREQREQVCILLRQYHLNYSWLICELAKIGISVDKTSLSAILTGRRKRKKAEIVLIGSLQVLKRYGEIYAGSEISDIFSTKM